LQRAISLIERLCDIAAPRNYLAETREYLINAGIVAAVANHDTPALFRWLMEIISHQGIADRIARDYLDRHGQSATPRARQPLRNRSKNHSGMPADAVLKKMLQPPVIKLGNHFQMEVIARLDQPQNLLHRAPRLIGLEGLAERPVGRRRRFRVPLCPPMLDRSINRDAKPVIAQHRLVRRPELSGS
jgi:hypothetical protein